jgi:hypothetical protein
LRCFRSRAGSRVGRRVGPCQPRRLLGRPRLQLRRRARAGVPRGDQGPRTRAIRPHLPAVPPGYRFPYGHTHKTQEEVYVAYPASASADRCLLRTESEISRLSRMSENGNHRTGESIAHICRRKGAWISSSNTASLTVAMPETHDADRKPSRRKGRPQRSQSRLHQVPNSREPYCRGWRAYGGRPRRRQAPRQR